MAMSCLSPLNLISNQKPPSDVFMHATMKMMNS